MNNSCCHLLGECTGDAAEAQVSARPDWQANELLTECLPVQCLFATETFAMGLNMPATTCVFTAMRKWDGESNRQVTLLQPSPQAAGHCHDAMHICKLAFCMSGHAF